MKRIFFLLLLIISSSSLSYAKKTIRFYSDFDLDNPKGQMIKKFKELIEEDSGGALIVDIKKYDKMIDGDEAIKSILLKDAEMAAPSLSKFYRYTQKLQIFDIPFIFKDIDAVDRFQKSKVGQELLNSLIDFNIKGLGYLHQGMKILSSNSDITLPIDMQGRKYRIQDSNVIADQFEALEAIPVRKPLNEAINLIKDNSVDGTENSWINHYQKGFYNEQKYTIESYHGYIGYLVILSKDFFDSLSKKEQNIIISSIKEAIEFGNNFVKMKNRESRESTILSGKTRVRKLTNSEKKLWVRYMKPVWDEYRISIGSRIINAALESNL